MHRAFALAAFLAVLSAGARAAEKAPAAGSAEPTGKGAPGTNVDMPYLMAPMNGADGKLSGYAYISTILTATSPTGALAVRNQLAFIQDAYVRDVNATPIAKPDDPTSVDQNGLQARLLADAKRVMGPGQVAALVIVRVQVTPLHPTQTVAPAGQLPAEPPPTPPKKDK
jgi:hypothetical protein